MNHCIATRAFTVTLLSVATVLPALTASAAVVPTPSWIVVNSVAGGFDVCAHGESDSTVTNTWVFRIDGVRVYDPTVMPETEDAAAPLAAGTVIAYSSTGSGRVFHTCLFLSTDNAKAGHAHMTLVYGGAATDVAVALVGAATWADGWSNGTGSGIG